MQALLIIWTIVISNSGTAVSQTVTPLKTMEGCREAMEKIVGDRNEPELPFPEKMRVAVSASCVSL